MFLINEKKEPHAKTLGVYAHEQMTIEKYIGKIAFYDFDGFSISLALQH